MASAKELQCGNDAAAPLRDESDLDAFCMQQVGLDWPVGQAEIDTIAGFAKSVKTAFDKAKTVNVQINTDVTSCRRDVTTRIVNHNHHMGHGKDGQYFDHGVVYKKLGYFLRIALLFIPARLLPTAAFVRCILLSRLLLDSAISFTPLVL
jgi:hypothetical protein